MHGPGPVEKLLGVADLAGREQAQELELGQLAAGLQGRAVREPQEGDPVGPAARGVEPALAFGDAADDRAVGWAVGVAWGSGWP